MTFIDSHCHLTDPQFDRDREAVLERARAAGVAGFLVIGATGDFSHNQQAVALAQQHGDVFAVLGVHPHDAKTITPDTYARLRELAREPGVVGLGETGLDFYYDHSPREDQRIHFCTFIRLARELGLPLSMHVRDAYAEAAQTLAVKVYSIGVGMRGRAPMPAGRNPFTGETMYQWVPVDIDEETLQKISQMTSGKYYRADNSERFQAIYAEIDKLEKTEAEVKKFTHHRELFAWVISPGLGLLLLEILLRHTMFRRLP